MGCQSSKAAVRGQGPEDTKLSAGNTLLANSSLNPKKPADESASVALDSSTPEIMHSKSAVSTGTSRSGAFRKQSTVSLKREDVDVLVTKFACSTTRQSKDLAWTVQASRELTPLEIKLHVDRSILLSPEVNVTCDGNKLFPNSSDRAKGKMLEDFRYQWPFRGTLREGINEPHRFEMRPPVATEPKQWYPAIITKQRGDGLFEMLAEMPDHNGVVRRVNFPAVSKNDIREAGSEESLHVSEQCLMLEVPKRDPHLAALTVDGHGVTTHFFGRPTPTVDREEHAPSFVISDDRKRISANVGHGVLAHFLSGDVRNVASDLQRHHRSWTIQIGPFAEHIVKINRHAWPSKIVTLTVDDDVLVDASAEDLGCASTTWECKFHFASEKVMNFDVFETNLDGVPLETRGQIMKREKKLYECVVSLPDDMDFSKAEFVVDDVYFQDLPPKATLYAEENVSMELDTFIGTYGPIVPRKINREAPIGLMGGLMAFAKEGGTIDTATAVAGLTVMRAAAADAARSGVAAAVSAAVSGAEAMSTAAVDYSPIVAEAAEKTAKKAGHSLSGMFAMCCNADVAEDTLEADVHAEPSQKYHNAGIGFSPSH